MGIAKVSLAGVAAVPVWAGSASLGDPLAVFAEVRVDRLCAAPVVDAPNFPLESTLSTGYEERREDVWEEGDFFLLSPPEAPEALLLLARPVLVRVRRKPIKLWSPSSPSSARLDERV